MLYAARMFVRMPTNGYRNSTHAIAISYLRMGGIHCVLAGDSFSLHISFSFLFFCVPNERKRAFVGKLHFIPSDTSILFFFGGFSFLILFSYSPVNESVGCLCDVGAADAVIVSYFLEFH